MTTTLSRHTHPQTDGERLKTLPPPEVALKYYNGDTYLFDEFQARVVFSGSWL